MLWKSSPSDLLDLLLKHRTSSYRYVWSTEYVKRLSFIIRLPTGWLLIRLLSSLLSYVCFTDWGDFLTLLECSSEHWEDLCIFTSPESFWSSPLVKSQCAAGKLVQAKPPCPAVGTSFCFCLERVKHQEGVRSEHPRLFGWMAYSSFHVRSRPTAKRESGMISHMDGDGNMVWHRMYRVWLHAGGTS